MPIHHPRHKTAQEEQNKGLDALAENIVQLAKSGQDLGG